MKLPCLFALVIFVAFQEVIPVPVPEADAKDPTIEAADEIVNKVEDALSTGDGRKALLDILEKRKNKKDESKDINGKNDESIQLDKKSAENEKEEELRSMIVENVKDALEEGEGKDEIQQLVDGDNADTTDEKEDFEDKDGVPAAIKDELEQDTDTTNPDPLGDISDDVPMLQTGENPNGYIVNDEGNFNDPASDLTSSDEMDDDQTFDETGKDTSSDSSTNGEEIGYKFQEINDNNDGENEATSNPGYYVSEPFTTNDDISKLPQGIQNDDTVDDNTDVNPADLNDTPDDVKSQDDVDNGYFVSDKYSADEDSTKLTKDVKNEAADDVNTNVVPLDQPESPAVPNPIATGSQDVPAASDIAPAGSDTKVKDTTNKKEH